MGVNLGYGENLFYYLRNDIGNDFDTFGTIATSGARTDRFGAGFNFDALCFASPNLAYGPDLFYYIRLDPAVSDFSTFGTLSANGETIDRFGLGNNFDAITFAAKDLGYGPNLFYYLRHNPDIGNFSTFGTISTSGIVTDRFGVGANFDDLVFVEADLAYGPNLFDFLRRDAATKFSTFGTISTSGITTDRFGVGLNVDALAFSAENVGYGPSLFYFLRRELAGTNISMFGTISVSGAVVDRFGAAGTYDALTFAAETLTPQSIVFGSAPPVPAVAGGTYSVSASGGSSGNAVVLTSLTPRICGVAGNSVTFAYPGICKLAAEQEGSATFGAAQRVTQLIQVTTIAELVAKLGAFLRSIDIPAGMSKSLEAKISKIEKALATKKPKDACNSLKEIAYDVAAQTGKDIPEEQATALKMRTSQIASLLGC